MTPIRSEPGGPAVGILARPTEALQLLMEHQHDPTGEPESSSKSEQTNQSTEPADPDTATAHEAAGEPASGSSDPDAAWASEPSACQPDPTDESEPDVEPDDHQSLSLAVPPGFNAKVARPQVVLHFHLSEAALRAGHALV